MERTIPITVIGCAQHFLGLKEVAGATHNNHVLAMLQLDSKWVQDDETAWCSAFVNYVCWLLNLSRSKSLAARSWLSIGQSVPLVEAERGDVVVLKRGKDPQPGPEVIKAPGHVGFYFGQDAANVEILGGNQGNSVSVMAYPKQKVLSVRRLV